MIMNKLLFRKLYEMGLKKRSLTYCNNHFKDFYLPCIVLKVNRIERHTASEITSNRIRIET